MMEEELERLLKEHGIRWQRNGKWFQPTTTDIRAVLDDARKILTNAPDNTEFDQASILVRKEDGDMNVYLHIGEL